MKLRNRIFSIICILVLLICLIFSYEYVVSNAEHDCSGKDCSVCIQLETAVHFISSIKTIPVLSSILIALCVFTQAYAIPGKSICIKNTLISLKVELLN